MRKKLLYAFKHSLLLGVSLVLTLIGLEISLKLTNFPYQPSETLYSNKQLLERNQAWVHASAESNYRPNSKHSLISQEFRVEYTVDGNGYLGFSQIPDTEKEPWVAIGDSFTFGYGVDQNENFVSLLGGYNAGLWGVSYPGHANAYRQIADKITHSMVIWTIYPPHLITLAETGWQSGIICPVKNGSLLERFITAWNRTKLSALLVYTTGYGVNTFDYYNKEHQIYSKDASLTLGNSIHMLTEAGKEILRICRLNNAQPRAIIIPSKTQLQLKDGRQPLFPLRQRTCQLDGTIATELVKEALLKAGFHANEISVYDCQVTEDISGQFFQRDAHWNANGHRKFAEFLQNLH